MPWEDEYNESRRQRRAEQRAADEEYHQQWKPGMPPAMPSSTLSDDDLLLLSDLGGPIEISAFPRPRRVNFSGSCSLFPERAVLSVLMKYTTDLGKARRHWPWVAHALNVYRVTPHFHDSRKDLTPSQAKDLLKSIRSAAASLEQALNALQEAALLWRDGSGDKGGHLSYLEQLLAQGAAEHPAAAVEEDPIRAWGFFDQYRVWRSGLHGLVEGARYAQAASSPELLTSKNRSRRPGLKKLVRRLGEIWHSLTDRRPSVQKVHTQNRAESKVVLFVQDVAALSHEVQVPTPSEVASALGQHNKR
jgi:hypothetical protein